MDFQPYSLILSLFLLKIGGTWWSATSERNLISRNFCRFDRAHNISALNHDLLNFTIAEMGDMVLYLNNSITCSLNKFAPLRRTVIRYTAPQTMGHRGHLISYEGARCSLEKGSSHRLTPLGRPQLLSARQCIAHAASPQK